MDSPASTPAIPGEGAEAMESRAKVEALLLRLSQSRARQREVDGKERGVSSLPRFTESTSDQVIGGALWQFTVAHRPKYDVEQNFERPQAAHDTLPQGNIDADVEMEYLEDAIDDTPADDTPADDVEHNVEDPDSAHYTLLDEQHDAGVEVKNLKYEIDQAIKDYAEISCREICDNIQNRLPPVVRAQIYEEVHGPKAFILADGIDPEAVERETPGLDIPRILPWNGDLGLTHIRDTQYVGKEAIVELAEAWYRVHTPLLRLGSIGSIYDRITQFLRLKDMWDTDSSRCLFTKVHFRISQAQFHEFASLEFNYQTYEMGNNLPDGWLDLPFAKHRLGFEKSMIHHVRDIDYLVDFGRRTRITIEVPNLPMNVAPVLLPAFIWSGLKFIFPALKYLRRRGLIVEGLIEGVHIDENVDFSPKGWKDKFMESK